MSKAYRIFVDYENAKKFAKEHNGTIIVTILGTGRTHYEVEYEDEEEEE